MSTLSVNTVKSLNTNAPVFQNTSGTEKGQLCKAWVNFDGTFGTSPFTEANGGIRDSFNVSSVTDNGEGKYTVTFTNALANADYCPVFGFARSDSNMIVYVDDDSDGDEMTVSACKFRTTNSWSSGGTLDEVGKVFLAFFGD